MGLLALMAITGCGKRQEQRQASPAPFQADDHATANTRAEDPPAKPMSPAPRKKQGEVISVVDGIEQVYFNQDKQHVISIVYDTPLKIAVKNGKTYELRVTKTSEASAKYDWRTLPDGAKSGSGTVYENIKTHQKGNRYIDLPSSQCMILMEDIIIPWNSGGTFNYQICYMPDELEILSD